MTFRLIRQSEIKIPSIYTSYPRNEACACGSKLRAKNCCLINGKWNKKPSDINPPGEITNFGHQACYANSTNNCSEQISREHCVSKSVLHSLTEDSVIQVSGMNWIPGCESKVVGISSLTAKVLCQRHNNALSPVDSEFQRFISTISSFDGGFRETISKDEVAVFSGEDIERWMLKTICCKVSSGVVAKDGQISNVKMKQVWLDLLYNRNEWPETWGLYINMSESFALKKYFGLRILVANDNNEVLAAEVYVNNIKFHLLLGKPEPPESFGVRRPRTLLFQFKNSVKIIELSWRDKNLKDQILLSRKKVE